MTARHHNLTEKNFDKEVSKGKWIVDFWAEWCNPCKILEPHFDSASHELKGKANFGKIDIDAETELAERFEVMSIPTVIFFKDGEIVDRVVGVIEKEEIVKMAKEAFR